MIAVGAASPVENPVSKLIALARQNRSTKLDLSRQELTELPDSIGELDSLVALDLSNNQLTRLPDSIGNLHRLTQLYLQSNDLAELPETIGNLTKLRVLAIHENRLNKLPESIGNLTELARLRPCRNKRHNSKSINNINCLPENISNLVNLKHLHLNGCQLAVLPLSIGNLTKLSQLFLARNQLTTLPENIGDLTRLNQLYLSNNQLTVLPDSIGQLTKLKELDISRNQIMELPETLGNLVNINKLSLERNNLNRLPASISNIVNLTFIDLNRNPIEDLSPLQYLPALKTVRTFNINLPRRYWTKFSEWKAEWLLDEKNAEIRRRLIEHIGYERICEELEAIAIDIWQEYTLLKIDNIQIVYQGRQEVGREAMMLLKMTCPSTAHIHILRVPPDLTSAEAAIVWVNHGIHPSQFSIQT